VSAGLSQNLSVSVCVFVTARNAEMSDSVPFLLL
jgi:hypothetical protein